MSRQRIQKVHSDVSCTKIYIWPPKKSGPFKLFKDNPKDYGHAAMAIDANDDYWIEYVSVSPVKMTDSEARRKGIKNELGKRMDQPLRQISSYEEDRNNRGDPEYVRTITWLNTDSMRAEWNEIRSDFKYNLKYNNCANACKRLLFLGAFESQAVEELGLQLEKGENIYLDLAQKYLDDNPLKLIQATALQAKVTGSGGVQGDEPFFSPSDLLLIADIFKSYQIKGHKFRPSRGGT